MTGLGAIFTRVEWLPTILAGRGRRERRSLPLYYFQAFWPPEVDENSEAHGPCYANAMWLARLRQPRPHETEARQRSLDIVENDPMFRVPRRRSPRQMAKVELSAAP